MQVRIKNIELLIPTITYYYINKIMKKILPLLIFYSSTHMIISSIRNK